MLAKIDLTDAFATEVAVVNPSGDIEMPTRSGTTLPSGAAWIWRGAATARGCSEASDVADGLRQVLDGASDLFVTTYACPFAGRYHWYQVLISPIYRSDVRHAI